MKSNQFKWAEDMPTVHIFGEDPVSEPGKKPVATLKPVQQSATQATKPVSTQLTKAIQAPGSVATAAATPKPVQQTTTTKPLQRGIVKPILAPELAPEKEMGRTKAPSDEGAGKDVRKRTFLTEGEKGRTLKDQPKATLAPELAGEQPALTGTKPVTQPKLTLKDQPKATLAPELAAQKEVGRTKAPSDEGAVKLPKLGNLTEGEKGRSFREPRVPILAPELKGENPAVSTPKRTMTPNIPAKAILAPEQEEKTPEQKVMNWIIDWAGRNGIFTDNFKNRYANRTWDYTDAYVGDAQDYLDTVIRETQNFEAELNGIRELMAQCNFSPEQMEHIGRLLNLSAEHYKLIRQTAEEDAAHWTQFGSAEEYQKVLEAAKIKVELDEMAGVKDEADKLLSQISTFNPYAYADAAQAAEAEQALKAQLAELTKPWGGWNGFENAYAEKQEQYNSLLGIETGSWFQKGAFADGYQFGDVTKTLVGTVNDINENITHAVLDATENLIDTGAFVVGQVAGRYGATDFQDKVGEFIAKESLTKDEMGAKLNSILNWTTPHGQATKLVIGDNTEANSVLGDKADGLTQSAAHLVGSKALSMVGIPAELTMGVNAFGSEIENAYKNGASHAEALVSGAVAVGAEILFEKLSGGIKFGGKTLDEGATKALSRNLSNRIIRSILKWTGNALLEGGEGYLTDATTNVVRKLTYADDKTWKEIFWSEEALDSFIGEMIIGGGFSGYDAVNSHVNGRDYAAGLTANEEKLVRQEYEKHIAEAMEKGQKLSAADKNKIWEAAVEEILGNQAAISEIGKVGWDGRVAVEPATGPNITVDGKTYALIGKDANGTPVYQDVEVLKEQAEAESKQTDESESVSQEESALQETETEENPEWFATALDSAEASSADRRDNLTSVAEGHIMDLQRGFMCFPEGDPLIENSKNVAPKEGFFDVAMHGSPTAVAFGGREANMSPRLLAEVIRHNPNYHGENIRLLCCSTGLQVDGAYCFAEELANALGVTVEAPNMEVFTDANGNIKVGRYGEGQMIEYKPNERGRIK